MPRSTAVAVWRRIWLLCMSTATLAALLVDKIVAVDDCGNVANPMIVEGQVQGGIAQAVGQAHAARGPADVPPAPHGQHGT
jgi:hypothetical protein